MIFELKIATQNFIHQRLHQAMTVPIVWVVVIANEKPLWSPALQRHRVALL